MPNFNTGTSQADLIVPEVFSAYVQKLSTQTDRLVQSGILSNDPLIQGQLLLAGEGINIPMLNPLAGDAQAWDDAHDIAVDKVTSTSSYAPKIYQTKAFGYTDWGTLTTGAPVQEAIAGQFAKYWNSQNEKLLIAVLSNTFANDDMKEAKSFGIGSETDLSAGNFLAAIARMGDVATPLLTNIVVNSSTYQAMRAQNLIETIQPSNGGAPISLYNGINIITDDSIPADAKTGITEAYIVANGAVGYGNALPANSTELKRDALGNGGQDAVINRRAIAMQVRGTKFADPTKVKGLSLETFAGESLYALEGDPREIGVVKYSFKIDPKFIVAGINTPVGGDKPATPSKSTKSK